MMVIESISYASAFHMLVWSVSEQCINCQVGTICLNILWLKKKTKKKLVYLRFYTEEKISKKKKKKKNIRPTDPLK